WAARPRWDRHEPDLDPGLYQAFEWIELRRLVRPIGDHQPDPDAAMHRRAESIVDLAERRPIVRVGPVAEELDVDRASCVAEVPQELGEIPVGRNGEPIPRAQRELYLEAGRTDEPLVARARSRRGRGSHRSLGAG